MPPLTLPIPQDLADRLAALAEATLARVRRGEERVYTSEEMDHLLETMHP